MAGNLHGNRWASRRAGAMPASVFAAMDDAKREAAARGLELIDLSIGSSDLPPPPEALAALRSSVDDRRTYGYCLQSCTRPLREAVAAWYEERYGPAVDPEREVLPLIGSQEGLANLLLATTDPGDTILLPDPAYPSYFGAVAAAGLEPHPLPLREERGFLPALEEVPDEVAARARVLLLSYPNNPTAGVADEAFFDRALAFCERHDLLLVHDLPYLDMVFGGYEAPSAWARPGARERVVELFSLSKSFHLAGFRLGWAVGAPDALAALARLKGAIDFNQYLGIQRAAIAALGVPRERLRRDAAVYQARRDALVESLNDAGWPTPTPRATMFVWTRLPGSLTDSYAFAEELARETGVCVSPGRAFGPTGEGYIRLALVQEEATLREAVRRMRAFLD